MKSLRRLRRRCGIAVGLFSALMLPCLLASEEPGRVAPNRDEIRQRILDRRAQVAATRAERQRVRQLRQDARRYRQYQVPGEEVAKRVKRLTEELAWHHDLESARRAARESGKPIVWIQALGDLDGFL